MRTVGATCFGAISSIDQSCAGVPCHVIGVFPFSHVKHSRSSCFSMKMKRDFINMIQYHTELQCVVYHAPFSCL